MQLALLADLSLGVRAPSCPKKLRNALKKKRNLFTFFTSNETCLIPQNRCFQILYSLWPLLTVFTMYQLVKLETKKVTPSVELSENIS